MKILIYNNHNDEVIQRIQNTLNTFQNCQIIFSQDYHTFKKKFSFCLSGETLIVFFIKNELDIRFLESIHNDFVDIKLIIDLSENKSYQARALKLQPRLITNADENTELLIGVIQGCVKENLKNRPLGNIKQTIREYKNE